ncbi:hypothetical protein B0H11DRAFT_1973806 [Mycena galericulata]|nr:hypothetical protein B0H11DRAFT_1973806 [Mycena galericulata]
MVLAKDFLSLFNHQHSKLLCLFQLSHLVHPLGAGCHRAGGAGAGATHPTSHSFSRCFDVVALRPRPDLLKNWPLGPACSIMHMHSSTTYATHFSSLSSPGPLIHPFRHIQMEQATPHPTNFTPVHPGPRTTHEPCRESVTCMWALVHLPSGRLADGHDGRYTTNIHTLVGPMGGGGGGGGGGAGQCTTNIHTL